MPPFLIFMVSHAAAHVKKKPPHPQARQGGFAGRRALRAFCKKRFLSGPGAGFGEKASLSLASFSLGGYSIGKCAAQVPWGGGARCVLCGPRGPFSHHKEQGVPGMKIIIAGDGKVGIALTRQLLHEGHDVTLSLIHISEPTRP